MSGTRRGLASECDQERKARERAAERRRWGAEDGEGKGRCGQRQRRERGRRSRGMAASAAAMEEGEKPRKLGDGWSVASKRRRWRSATRSCGTRRDGEGDGGNGGEEDIGNLVGLLYFVGGFERECGSRPATGPGGMLAEVGHYSIFLVRPGI